MKPTKQQLEELDYCSQLLKEHDIKFKYNELLSPCRKAELVFIRALIVIILRNKGYSLEKTGRILNRDHATILHAEKYTRKQGRNKKYSSIIRAIRIKTGNVEAIEKMEYHLDELIRLTAKLDESVAYALLPRLQLLKIAIIPK